MFVLRVRQLIMSCQCVRTRLNHLPRLQPAPRHITSYRLPHCRRHGGGGVHSGYRTLTCVEEPKYGVILWGRVYYVFRCWSLVLCMDGQVQDQCSIGSKEVSVESKKLEAQ
jgi:hypothetical protein